MTKEELFLELEDLLRTIPERANCTRNSGDFLSWQGRAAAIIKQWDLPSMIRVGHFLNELQNVQTQRFNAGYNGLIVLLHQARNDLRMQAVGPANALIASTMVFDYFDEIRKIINLAREEILFVDPYLDAEFVSRYLPHIKEGVSIRLLTREKINTKGP